MPIARDGLMTANKPMSDDAKVWRYRSFSRFIWLLQKKQLWMARADRLGDAWEISLAGNQLEHVISRHPITPITEAIRPKTETAMQRAKRINRLWRQRTFVSCWNTSDHESHALWRIYCGSSEGVALQTTFVRLRQSVGALPVYRVAYEIPGIRRQTPTVVDLVTKKRPMFAYEHEVRVVRDATSEPFPEEALGYPLEWDPELILQSVLIHPDADFSFMETVRAAVAHYAPALKDCIVWSSMREPPPF
jgi:hypothetical protein